MSCFKNEIIYLQVYIKMLCFGVGVLVIVVLVMGGGWWSVLCDLIIYVLFDLCFGSICKWWEVLFELVYVFMFYVFQIFNCWLMNGEEDYLCNFYMFLLYFILFCQVFFKVDYDYCCSIGELCQWVCGIYEIFGCSYGDNFMVCVCVIFDCDWVVMLDISVDEYYGVEQVKCVLVCYFVKVVWVDVDFVCNLFGLVIDCYEGMFQCISVLELMCLVFGGLML